jgi:hypothetical protein
MNRREVPLEKRVKDEVRERVKRWPGAVQFCYIPGEPGIPDRLVCLPVRIDARMVGMVFGLLVGIECKRRHKLLTPIQKAKKRQLKKAGAIIVRVSSGQQLERIENFLRRALRCQNQKQ